jgi:hypothetical protein
MPDKEKNLRGLDYLRNSMNNSRRHGKASEITLLHLGGLAGENLDADNE